ncbi:ABC transporter substrate-binding protein [Klenkia taihuensis]|uniref:Iron complex transport system substrate-binding protein n=1 Tax=Klenkia taihuensis TaxID=1225127 RepID=A0A1I1UVV6_9ACTN|nr:ABC transporter substrate-binding protein [Klenkia taihuensis]GHE13933.1 cobalamin-binding protein [Klenkia taihuensis]SFD72983.1 iron complex transport system substrate-binding protein [Klenkia taihuensis]
MRVVSLLPSATEVVAALGLADDLVGVSFECDRPPGIRERAAVVVGGLDTAGLGPGEVDAAVRARVAAGEDLYTLHAGALADLAPDLVISQNLCQVCALPAGTVRDALAHLGTDADVLTLDPHTLDEVLATITAVGGRAGVPGRAAELVAALRARLDAVGAAVAGRPRPRVAVVEWTDPPFTAGHWVPDLVTAAGGEPVGAASGARSVTTTWGAIDAGDPEVVLVAPCGYGLDAAVEQARTVAGHLPGRTVWAIDADGLVVRPGPRLVDGVEAIAAVLHPDVVPPSAAVARVSG